MTENEAKAVVVGVDHLAKAIPAAVWKRLVDTACGTFEKALAPLTETTSGLGRWISEKFNTLTELEKINAAGVFQLAREKVESSGCQPSTRVEPKVMVAMLCGGSQETEEDMRELWANLIAEEALEGGVHPAIPGILSQMTVGDAKTLANLHKQEGGRLPRFLTQRSLNQQTDVFAMKMADMIRERETVSEAVLAGKGLIRKDGMTWVLTALGKEFIRCVKGRQESSGEAS